MRRSINPMRAVSTAACLSLALGLAGCDTNSPTEPQQQGAPRPGSGTASAVWNITLTASPATIAIDGVNNVFSTITAVVRRADTGQPPPNGSTMLLSATSPGFFTDSTGAAASTVAVTLNNGSAQVTLQAPGTAGTTIVVQGQLEQSFGQTAVELVFTPEPEPDPFFIESVNPNTGPPSGARVRIRGGGFEEPVRVLFGDRPAVVQSVSAELITADAPPIDLGVNQTQTVSVSVTINLNSAGQATDSLANAFTYARGGDPIRPRVISVTPTTGPNEGGTRVTITGEGFASRVQVFFSGATLVEAPVVDVSSTRILATTPAATGINSANKNSIVDVRVVNLDSGFEDTLLNAFQYGNPDGGGAVQITSIGPGEASYLGGTLVTFFGQGFEEPVAVGLAGIAQQVISVTGTEIIARTVRVQINNCTDVQGPSSVTNLETNESANGPNFIFRALSPTIFDLSPNVSPEAGGGTVTITGVNFFAPLRVLFTFDPGDVAAGGVVVVNSSTITATIPAFSGDFDTEECDDTPGDGQTGERFIPTRVGVRVVNLETGCEDEFENAFTYTPADQSCRNDDAPPPPPTPPSASFVVTSIVGTTANFLSTSSGTPPLSLQWFFGDGGAATTMAPSHDYGMSGTFTVTLTVTNAGGVSVATQDVTIP